MADRSDTGPKPGEKRSATDKTDSEKPLKLRRFDMKTRVCRHKSTESVPSSDGGDWQDTKLHVEKGSGSQHGAQASDSAYETMSVNMMFRTSFELQQAESCGGNRERKGSSPHTTADRNIVDKLFQDFVAIKMKEVDDSVPSQQGLVSLPVEEMNRLLDEEITSIKSRSVVSNLYDEDSQEANDSQVKQQGVGDCNDSAHSSADGSAAFPNSSEVLYIAQQSESSCGEPSKVADSTADLDVSGHSPSESGVKKAGEWAIGVKAVFEHPLAHSGACDWASSAKAVLGKKPLHGVKKLGVSIGQESLARILGIWKNGKILEDGEVASSTDSDADKRSKAEEGVDEGSEDSVKEMSETGSLSDSNEDKKGAQDSKSKKKKKHKHKHKKKKKHKSQNKEKEKDQKEKDGHFGEGKCSKEKKEKDEKEPDKHDGDVISSNEKKEKCEKEKRHPAEGKSSKEKQKKEERKKESRSKDKKKHRRRSRSNSKSSQKVKKSGSGSTLEFHSKSDRRSKEKFDPWDARSYRSEGVKSPPSSSSKHKDRPGDRSHDRSRDRSPNRSRDRSKEKSRRKSRDHYSDGERRRSGSCDRHKDKRHGHHKDRAETSSDLRIRIDKNKLRKIAIARALANMEKGQGPAVDLTAVKSGGKSVEELTEFCKRISEKERDHGTYESSDSDTSEEGGVSEGEEAPLHHPFKMRDPSTLPNIVMNIRNAKQLPVLTPQEKQTQAAQLRSQFPVSSGTQHRIKESEWVPVTPATTTTTTTKAKAATAAAVATMLPATVVAATAPPASGGGETEVGSQTASTAASAELTVFPVSQPDINIGSIISERIQAMRRLEENPFDIQALSSVHKMNEKANAWAQSKHLPGQFTGSTDVRILSQQELAGPDKRNQAWAKKREACMDQFRKAPPVQGGIGMYLLQKMGWKPGDGLGKDNEGSREPLMLDVKMDRKGLATSQENRPQQVGRVPPTAPRAKDLSGKHPVSALTELCTKRRWGAPAFELINESGPPHKKMFLFKVKVNGVDYIPTTTCANKKLAKAQAAAVCLQEMGLIPRDFVVQA